MAGTIRIEIEPNGAVKADLSNFKKCEQKTEELMKSLDFTVDKMKLKTEEVQTVSTSTVTVGIK